MVIMIWRWRWRHIYINSIHSCPKKAMVLGEEDIILMERWWELLAGPMIEIMLMVMVMVMVIAMGNGDGDGDIVYQST